MKTTTTRKGWALRYRNRLLIETINGQPRLFDSKVSAKGYYAAMWSAADLSPVYCTITTTIETRETRRKA